MTTGVDTMSLLDALKIVFWPPYRFGGGNTVEMKENWTEYAAFSDEGSLEMSLTGESWLDDSIWRMTNHGPSISTH